MDKGKRMISLLKSLTFCFKLLKIRRQTCQKDIEKNLLMNKTSTLRQTNINKKCPIKVNS